MWNVFKSIMHPSSKLTHFDGRLNSLLVVVKEYWVLVCLQHRWDLRSRSSARNVFKSIMHLSSELTHFDGRLNSLLVVAKEYWVFVFTAPMGFEE